MKWLWSYWPTLCHSQGLQLLPAEMDFVWSLLDRYEPGQELHQYRQVMNFFYNRTRPIVNELQRLKRYESKSVGVCVNKIDATVSTLCVLFVN